MAKFPNVTKDVLGASIWDAIKSAGRYLYDNWWQPMIAAFLSFLDWILNSASWPVAIFLFLGIFAVLATIVNQLHAFKWRRNLNREKPQPLINRQSWDDINEMNRAGKTLAVELEGVQEAWLSFISGAHLDTIDENLLPKITRLILSHPDCEMMKSYREMLGERAKMYPDQIRRITRKCLEKKVDVKWSRNPVLNVIFGDPTSEDAWVRKQWQMPYTLGAVSPIDLIIKRDQFKRYQAIKGAYDKSFSGAETPSGD